jgi:hypothetical protein
MYWLSTKNGKYEDFNGIVFYDRERGLVRYHELIEHMMANLPKEEWFDLRLMRVGEEGDYLPHIDQTVRSWVY